MQAARVSVVRTFFVLYIEQHSSHFFSLFYFSEKRLYKFFYKG